MSVGPRGRLTAVEDAASTNPTRVAEGDVPSGGVMHVTEIVIAVLIAGTIGLLCGWLTHARVASGPPPDAPQVPNPIGQAFSFWVDTVPIAVRRALFDDHPDMVCSLDRDGQFTEVNWAFQSTFGYQSEELLDLSFTSLVVLEDYSRAISHVDMAVQGHPQTCDLTMLTKEGHRIAVQLTGIPVRAARTVLGIYVVIRGMSPHRTTETLLHQSEARYRSLVEQSPAITYTLTADATTATTATTVSQQIETILGYTAAEYTTDPTTWRSWVHPDDRTWVVVEFDRAIQSGAPFEMEHRFVAKGGQTVWVRHAGALVGDEAGEAVCWQGIITDITQRRLAEHALREAEARYRTLFDDAPLMYVRSETPNGPPIIADCNHHFLETLGYFRHEVIGRPLSDFYTSNTQTGENEVETLYWQTLDEDVSERTLRTRDGRAVEALVRARPYATPDGTPIGSHVALLDITERRTLERQLAYQAFYDPLTGLPNRALFLDHLSRTMGNTDRGADSMAILFLDLDNFKVINDSLGHDAGDRFLAAIGGRLRTCVRAEDLVARFGGDEFTVLLRDAPDQQEAEEIAKRIVAIVQEPVPIDQHTLVLTTSIGIAQVDAPDDDPHDLLRRADLALYRAKCDGKARYSVFAPSMNSEALERLTLEEDLRQALEQGDLRLDYQPIVDLATGVIREVEAFARWEHPERGVVPPETFVPVAEESGLIVPLGQQVLTAAARQASVWQAELQTDTPLAVSVNLSARQFREPTLVLDIVQVLQETGLDPWFLRLEITERLMAEEASGAIGMLQALKDLGVQLALDDFGTGYSSLVYLQRLPVDVLKIDHRFVAELPHNPPGQMLVRALIAAARALKLTVIAEGIETEKQRELLRNMGCERGQGKLFARPGPAEAIEQLLTIQRG